MINMGFYFIPVHLTKLNSDIPKCWKEGGAEFLLLWDRSVISIFALGTHLSLMCEIGYSYAHIPQILPFIS